MSISDQEENTKLLLVKFADDKILGGVVNNDGDKSVIQTNVEGLVK